LLNVDTEAKRIVRSSGSTPSERYLAYLADRTFLNLWSYPNPYREQKQRGAGDGKELCDLLVVCDPHIIIFSEKDISWSDEQALEVAWPRWFKKAVLEAANQLRGAERWINDFPERIFLDKDCTQPFPLDFPPVERRIVHRVIVARGAAAQCRNHLGGIGTLMICPELKGKSHCNPKADFYAAFTVGDVDPASDFVHVFDEISLELVMRELDTVSDFTEYLVKRSSFLRSGRLVFAPGEEELLPCYASQINERGEHDFILPTGSNDSEKILISEGNFAKYIKNPQYIAKKKADRISYLWDRLIEVFTDHMIAGTSLAPEGQAYSLQNSELAVRYMALENRWLRRAHSQALEGAFEQGRKREIFFRSMLGLSSAKNETGFFILTVKYLPERREGFSYSEYRKFRSGLLGLYAHSLLMKYPHLRRIIGIAMEPPGLGKGGSEDNVYAAQQEWTAEQIEEVALHCEAAGIMQTLKEKPYRAREFPTAAQSRSKPQGGNRKQRRAQAALERKGRKSH